MRAVYLLGKGGLDGDEAADRLGFALILDDEAVVFDGEHLEGAFAVVIPFAGQELVDHGLLLLCKT